VADTGPHILPTQRFEEIAMKSLYLAALIGLFACQAVYAADGTAAPAKARTQSAAKNADTNAQAGQATMSQQDRMRMCSKQATGKKGAERKTFMKSCLTTRKS